MLRLKLSALLELGRLDDAIAVEVALLRLDEENQGWQRYCEDALWLARGYEHANVSHRALVVLRYGRTIAVTHALFDQRVHFDRALGDLWGD
jgi:hypothetical protein